MNCLFGHGGYNAEPQLPNAISRFRLHPGVFTNGIDVIELAYATYTSKPSRTNGSALAKDDEGEDIAALAKDLDKDLQPDAAFVDADPDGENDDGGLIINAQERRRAPLPQLTKIPLRLRPSPFHLPPCTG